MTTPNSEVLEEVKQEQKRVIPEIKSEEDIPFSAESGTDEKPKPRKSADKKLGQTDDLTKFRFETGRTVLYVAMAVMAVMVLLDLMEAHRLETTSDLIESAFEAFKLITMTVLGYIFGSNSSKD